MELQQLKLKSNSRSNSLKASFGSLAMMVFMTFSVFTNCDCKQISDALALCWPKNGSPMPIEFNQRTQMCCDGVLHDYSTDSTILCCDNVLFDTTAKICCDNKLYNKTEGNEDQCCGKQLISSSNSLCCNNSEVNLTDEQREMKSDLNCCGPYVMDIRKSFCCGDTIHDHSTYVECCKNEIIDKKFWKCESNIKLKHTETFCGAIKFDVTEKTCCEGKLSNFPRKKHSCCGTTPYIRSEQRCCKTVHSHVIDKDGDLDCCGDDQYNTSNQFCIDGKPYDKKPGDSLCGRHPYDNKTTNCCKRIPYNPNTHKCCDGDHTTSVIPINKPCCNGQEFNDTIELCCMDYTPQRKRNEDDDLCCNVDDSGKFETYCSKKNEKCEFGQGVLQVDKGINKCVNKLYNSATQGCCQSDVFNLTTEKCCKGRNSVAVIPINQPCCNGQIFNDTIELCCMDYKPQRKRNEDDDLCCNVDDTDKFETYCSKKNERCEFGKGVVPKKNIISCNGKKYRVNKASKVSHHHCCGRRLMNTKKQQCCGDLQVYHTKRFTCEQDQRVVPLVEERSKSDTQRLCSKQAFKHSDLLLQQMCRRANVMTANVTSVKIRHRRKIMKLKLRLEDVHYLNGNERHFSSHTIKIEIEKGNGVRCRRHNLERQLKGRPIILFHDKELKRLISLKSNDYVFITLSSKRNLRKIQKFNSNNRICSKIGLSIKS